MDPRPILISTVRACAKYPTSTSSIFLIHVTVHFSNIAVSAFVTSKSCYGTERTPHRSTLRTWPQGSLCSMSDYELPGLGKSVKYLSLYARAGYETEFQRAVE